MNNHLTHKKITVTIGIPTYNEEATIAILLEKILDQTSEYAQIEKIHIVDDNSKDKTIEKIKEFTDKRIQYAIREKRSGQTSAQNLIFDEATTDVVLILEADTYPAEREYVDRMVQPLLKNPQLGFIQGNMVPLPSQTFVGHVLNKHFELFTEFVIKNKAFPVPIISGRGGRVFPKYVYTQLRWPASVPDDDYAAVWCLANNFSGAFSSEAHCYYKRPQTFDDYIKERQKIHNVEPAVKKHFSDEVIARYFQVPKKTRYLIMFNFMLRYPVEFFFHVGMSLTEKLHVKRDIYTDFWPKTKTTRDL